MSNILTEGFRTQLSEAMDSILRNAVFEIMKIFENSLHEHQMALVQKGEEIVQLQIKLQKAEIKMVERECGDDKGVAINETEIIEIKRKPEYVLNTCGETLDTPEIDFEVPDDWCAPLGCETLIKQDDDVCPSVRLRPLSIPLWHIPDVKEVVDRDVDFQEQIKSFRRSSRGSSLNKKQKHTQKRNLPTDSSNTVLRRRLKNLTGKEQELESKKMYTCKFCKKVFDTPFGRSVHVRSHKRCKGCRKDFPFPSILKSHQATCKKLRKLLARKAVLTNSPKPEHFVEEKPIAPSKKQEEKSPLAASDLGEPSVQNDGFTITHSCAFCNKTFRTNFRLEEHIRVHTGETPYSCSMCPKKFHSNHSFKNHMTRIHADQVPSNGDLAWTKPLEDIEDNPEDLISPIEDTDRAMNHKNNQTECSQDIKPDSV
ncbi:zinc finger protein 189-like isoform X2 [Mastacembelus armatus]|uniref:zinc finger protein 189-like isoform X2 n=1 Tax=Mastacembelus armatus TaxID=205130 RepID=UPI000E45A78A|nr:zinc finger protein 189-like isoform X2 [Mastacembelus armatus]